MELRKYRDRKSDEGVKKMQERTEENLIESETCSLRAFKRSGGGGLEALTLVFLR